MVKCDICKGKIETLFLGKINGTFVRKKGKKKTVCSGCQKKLGEKVLDEL